VVRRGNLEKKKKGKKRRWNDATAFSRRESSGKGGGELHAGTGSRRANSKEKGIWKREIDSALWRLLFFYGRRKE